MTTETVVMPKKLTAENNAKGLLIGEFEEVVVMQCCDCGGTGEDVYGTCVDCDGAGEYNLHVPVSWTTIKEIYDMAVKNLRI